MFGFDTASATTGTGANTGASQSLSQGTTQGTANTIDWDPFGSQSQFSNNTMLPNNNFYGPPVNQNPNQNPFDPSHVCFHLLFFFLFFVLCKANMVVFFFCFLFVVFWQQTGQGYLWGTGGEFGMGSHQGNTSASYMAWGQQTGLFLFSLIILAQFMLFCFE